jgi:hypothetical protein
VFGAMVTIRAAFPCPLIGVTLIQDTAELAVQGQFEPALSEMFTVPPTEREPSSNGLRE